MPSTVDIPTRDRERLPWARNALGDPQAQLQRASMDAGFRSYWRTSSPTRPGSMIVMDSPPAQEDVRPWLRIREMLDTAGVRVPQVLSADVPNGFVLLEDLGIDTYLQVINPGNADALFDDALTQLLTLQAITPPLDFPEYDEALLLRELKLFDEWFIGKHLDMLLDRDETQSLDLIHRRLVDSALAQPRVLVHRDFMPRNLMPANNGPAVLDFQDAVIGPIAYDVLSLFKDAFLSWPQAAIDGWLDRYHARAAEAGLPVPSLAQFRRDVDWIGVQRHLKVIGIFARLRHRDHKPKYLRDVPRFFAYLDGVLPKYPEFAALQALIDHRIKPAMTLLAEAPG